MEKLNLNHSADCVCTAFNTNCDRIQEMKQEMAEILKRADTITEAIDLAYEAGRTPEEKILYTFMLGRQFQHMKGGGGEEDSRGLKIKVSHGSANIRNLEDLLDQLFSGRRHRGNDDDENDG